MNVNVVSNTENKLLDRKEIDAEISFDGATPQSAELKAAVCQKIALSPDLTVLRKVENSFGTKSVRVTAYSYATKEALESTEQEYVKKREGMDKKPEEKKPEGEEAEAPKEEKPEEKKEEKPAEAKEVPKAEAKPEEKKEEAPKEEKPAETPKEEKKEPPKKPEEKKEEPKAEEK